jgi:hypothetical protein
MHLSLFCFGYFSDRATFCPGAILRPQSFCPCFPHSWDDKHMPLCPAIVCFSLKRWPQVGWWGLCTPSRVSWASKHTWFTCWGDSAPPQPPTYPHPNLEATPL